MQAVLQWASRMPDGQVWAFFRADTHSISGHSIFNAVFQCQTAEILTNARI
jgi:hypothetical protein